MKRFFLFSLFLFVCLCAQSKTVEELREQNKQIATENVKALLSGINVVSTNWQWRFMFDMLKAQCTYVTTYDYEGQVYRIRFETDTLEINWYCDEHNESIILWYVTPKNK